MFSGGAPRTLSGMSEGTGDGIVFECRHVLEEISNYVDEDVSDEVRRAIEEHLRHCRTCRVLIDSTRRSVRILADGREVELPAPLAQKIMSRVRGHRGESS